MDTNANKREQIWIATAILKIWDACPESGEPTAQQLDGIYGLAGRMAELVIALQNWEKRT